MKRLPKTKPKKVPNIPVEAPHIKNTRIIDPFDNPIVRNIPISLPLFFTNMIKPAKRAASLNPVDALRYE